MTIKTKLNTLFLCFGILFLVSSCETKMAKPQSVGLSEDSLKIATQRLHNYVDDGKLSGTFVRIIKEGKVVYNDQYGLIDIAKNKPVEEEPLYRIFSMTKPVTAVAIMTLHDQGKLNLDDKVSKYIPEFSNTRVYKNVNGKHTTDPQKKQLTIRHLLTHTSGIPYGWEWSYVDSIYNAKQHMRKDWIIEEMTKDIATIPLKFQPGTQYNYGLGIDVAGYIVEVVSGMKLDTYFKSAIFDPLAMDDTRFYVPKEKQDRMTELYTRDENDKLIVLEDKDIKERIGAGVPPKLLLGGAGLISSMGDYEKFCRMLLNKGKLNGKRILSERAAEIVMTDQNPEGFMGDPGMGHGLSGTVNLESGEYSWGGAAKTSFWINPTHDLIVICFTQLFSKPSEYAQEFKAAVDRAIIDSDSN